MSEDEASDGIVARLPLAEETVAVERRIVETGRVRVETQTVARQHVVDESLEHVRVEIERVPIGRVVDAPPPVREEGDVTILPVVEEVLVVERRLVLKEEVHIRRVRTHEQHRETVELRAQEVVVDRVTSKS
jgi:stress response protein YsnF